MYFKALGNDDSVLRTFYAFILPCFEYCSPVWCCESDSHLRLLDRALDNIHFHLPDLSVYFEDRRKFARFSLFYMILNNINHPLYYKLLQFAVPTGATQQNEKTFVLLRHKTVYYSILKMFYQLDN